MSETTVESDDPATAVATPPSPRAGDNDKDNHSASASASASDGCSDCEKRDQRNDRDRQASHRISIWSV